MATDFTIADVLAWARTKPANEPYNYVNPGNCALCHFLRDTGRATRPRVCPSIGTLGGDWRDGVGSREKFSYPKEMEPALVAGHTFGGLVKRLEVLCPETPITRSNWSRLDAYMTDLESVPA